MDQRPIIRPCDDDLARLAEMVNSARKVALFCGVECAETHDEVIVLADRLRLPLVLPTGAEGISRTTILSRGRGSLFHRSRDRVCRPISYTFWPIEDTPFSDVGSHVAN